MSVIPNVIPITALHASPIGTTEVLPILRTSTESERFQDALRARNVLVAHYGRYWLLASAKRPDLAIVLDPESPTLEYKDLDGGKILSGHVITLCEHERVEFLAITVGAK